MGPELAGISAALDLVREYGPWSIVMLTVWAIGTRRLTLGREYDELTRRLRSQADRAKDREEALEREISFWRDRHLQLMDVTQTALRALSGGQQGPQR